MRRYMAVAAAVLASGLAGCGGGADRIFIPVPDESEEAVLVDFTGGDITEPSAFDLISRTAVRTDQFEGWDFVLDFFPDGSAALWPRGGLVDDRSDSGLRLLDTTYDGLEEAPEGGYETLLPVFIRPGDVMAVRSRRDPAFGNVRCRRFAKVEILEIDAVGNTATFRYLVNPNCERRTLVPGAEE